MVASGPAGPDAEAMGVAEAGEPATESASPLAAERIVHRTLRS